MVEKCFLRSHVYFWGFLDVWMLTRQTSLSYHQRKSDYSKAVLVISNTHNTFACLFLCQSDVSLYLCNSQPNVAWAALDSPNETVDCTNIQFIILCFLWRTYKSLSKIHFIFFWEKKLMVEIHLCWYIVVFLSNEFIKILAIIMDNVLFKCSAKNLKHSRGSWRYWKDYNSDRGTTASREEIRTNPFKSLCSSFCKGMRG